MLAVCPPSHFTWAGMAYPNDHQYFSTNLVPPTWTPEYNDELDYTQLQQTFNLAYRPRVANFAYLHPYRMASPAATAVAAPDPTASEYPEDPSFEPNLDGRIEMNQDEIDAIIRNKRKVRDPKACYACHRRKVKCNRELPCDSCVKRDHPELCSYERPTKRRRIALTTQQSRGGSEEDTKEPAMQTGPNITVPREQWERINVELQQMREHIAEEQQQASGLPAHLEAEESNFTGTISRSDDATDREGIHAPSNQMGTMHLGARSVLAYMMGLGRIKSAQDNARGILEENILPKLGLDNESVTYPFVDLWSTDNSIKDINGLCSAIPDDQLCRE